MSAIGQRGSKAGGANGQTKKLVIKPLKFKPKLPDNFEELTWTKLQDAVNAVHCKRSPNSSLEELYRAVEDMCMHKMADSLYTKLQAECDRHIGREVAQLKELLQLAPAAFLERVDAIWRDYCAQMLTIRSIFLYLDRTYVITTATVKSLFDMGLQLLRHHLLTYPLVEQRVVDGLLQLIRAERQGESVDRPLVKSLVRMLSSLGMYGEVLQAPFLEQTQRYYQAEGQEYMQSMEVPDYLLHCERRLAEEFDRCQTYLEAGTRKALIGTVEAQLIGRHIGQVIERGLVPLLDAHRVADLARLYGLCARVSALDALRLAYKSWITKTGTVIVRDEAKDKEMVDRLLSLKSKLDTLLESSFQRSETFGNATKDALEAALNSRQNKPAEMVAKFMDAKLRTGSKGQSEGEIEGQLDAAMALFRFINGKDVFEAFYKRDLAKRLMLGKSSSEELEKGMIGKLKAECGAQFTAKLEGMFNDMEVSRDLLDTFHRAQQFTGRLPHGLDVNVQVLTSGFWPTYPLVEVKLPEELATVQSVFQEFYSSKQSGRQLQWHNSLGTCLLRARFPKGAKELSVSLFQAVVLCLFNEQDSYSYGELAQLSGIEDRELKRTLQSLACGKVRVLRKEPASKDVEAGDVFHFNGDFTEKLYRIRINTIQLKETEEENKKTNEQVLQDRQYQIDAAVVRVMKTRKSLSHKLLVAEVLQQLRFPLAASDLKKRIESLIEREYMERDSSNKDLYNYLA